ncbi:pyruvate synthase subunit porC [Candidatus Bathyarchaeota archaeon ex4484_135]|nr:MAG: pyruvate synthase subunit porC [Candidatus Bathyarchaeota archaeon ex4484_135]
MIEIRLHGRGGQGVWTAANLLALAAIREGKYAQGFPFFGPERLGAPVLAFARISDKPIRVHCMIYRPDVVGVLDPTLLSPSVVEGLKKDGILVLNSDKEPSELREILGLEEGMGTIWVLDASRMAIEILGREITNTAIMSAVARATGAVSLSSLEAVIKERFPPNVAEKNLELVRRAYEEVRRE